MDCNEPFAQIFGFESRADMLAHSAWDFYFDRIEREALINRLRSRGSCAAEEVCLRGRDTNEPPSVTPPRGVVESNLEVKFGRLTAAAHAPSIRIEQATSFLLFQVL